MKFMLATGGSGGHIFPALQVASALAQEGHEVIFIGAIGSALDKLRQAKLRYYQIEATGLTLDSPVKLVRFFILQFKFFVSAFSIIRKEHPHAVCGFGSYSSFPVVLAAKMTGIPTMIHEQNAIPGKANRWLAPIADKIAVSFESTEKFFERKKIILTGCPCRNYASKSKAEAFRQFQFQEDRKTILVLGGSQGSHDINQIMLKTIPLLLLENYSLQVIHISGRQDQDFLRQEYAQLGIPNQVYSFLDDIPSAYLAADVAVSRAGAVSVSELMAFQLPAVLIPYPYAGGHQKENAKILEEVGLGKMIYQENLSSENLKSAIADFLNSPEKLSGLGEKINKVVFPDAAKRVSHEIIKLAKN